MDYTTFKKNAKELEGKEKLTVREAAAQLICKVIDKNLSEEEKNSLTTEEILSLVKELEGEFRKELSIQTVKEATRMDFTDWRDYAERAWDSTFDLAIKGLLVAGGAYAYSKFKASSGGTEDVLPGAHDAHTNNPFADKGFVATPRPVRNQGSKVSTIGGAN